jgi:hypothetical protein
MRHDRPFEAVLVVHRRTRTARTAVLAAGFDPMAECDTLPDGLVLTVLYRPDLLVVDATIAGSPADLAELRAAADGAEVVLVTSGTDASDLAEDLAGAWRRLARRADAPGRHTTRGLPIGA